MLLDELVRCIEVLQERIRSYADVLRENETRTRMALIDPLLRVLDWDVSDPGVTPEYRVQDRRADYALLGHDGSPVAVVEAKKLGEPLKAHQTAGLHALSGSYPILGWERIPLARLGCSFDVGGRKALYRKIPYQRRYPGQTGSVEVYRAYRAGSSRRNFLCQG